jgi:hypothetical protein
MTRRYVNNSIGLAAMACLLFVPGLAHAASPCSNTYPSFSYTPVAKSGGTATVGITTAAGCLWEVTSNASWIRIVSANHGYGPGVIVFQVLPNPNRTTRRGTFGAPAVCGETIGGRSSVVCAAKYTITIDQYGQ